MSRRTRAAEAHPRYLTGFYLHVSLGGALGGIIVAILAPMIFNTYLELPLALVAVGVLAVITYIVVKETALLDADREWVWPTAIGLLLILQLAVLAVGFLRHPNVLIETRNFYGQLEVWENEVGTINENRFLVHGEILHGIQYLNTLPVVLHPIVTTWQIPALAMPSNIWQKGAETVGVVGLGIGTLAAYGEPGEYIGFYEINPEVVDLAEDLLHLSG